MPIELSTKDLDTSNQKYWDELADHYHHETKISCNDFHYGPLVPGDSALGLLPADVSRKRCLEFACGGGQNSIYLASQGAECVGLDISPAQLKHAEELAQLHNVTVDFQEGSMDHVDQLDLGEFDIIHSSFGLPFAADPGWTIKTLAEKHLKPGGIFVVSLAHPISAGEWLELDDEGEGMFVRDYFHAPMDMRFTEDASTMIFARSYPVAAGFDWLLQAGLTVTGLLEPEPMPLHEMEHDEIAAHVPYLSEDWLRLYPQLSKVPFLYILRGSKAK